MIQLEDGDPMPFGKYKGLALANVPADYLIYIYENMSLSDKMKKYIKKNMDGLKAEVKRQQRFNSR